MALSNLERQRRYIQRLKAKAAGEGDVAALKARVAELEATLAREREAVAEIGPLNKRMVELTAKLRAELRRVRGKAVAQPKRVATASLYDLLRQYGDLVRRKTKRAKAAVAKRKKR
jgi:hypothetical protein